MSDERLGFIIEAESGGFTAPMRAAARAAKDSSADIKESLAQAAAAAEKLNQIESGGFAAAMGKEASAATAAVRDIVQAVSRAQQSLAQLNATSTDNFAAQMDKAASSAETATKRILNAEAIRARFRAQQGADRNVDIFQAENAAPSQTFIGSQPARIRTAYAQQLTRNDSLDYGAAASQNSQRLAEQQRVVTELEARAVQEEKLHAQALQALDRALGIQNAALGESAEAHRRYSSAVHESGKAVSDGIPDRVKADAALRALNGNLFTGVRAAGTFAASIQGIEPLLAGAFTAVGAIALAGTLVELGKHALEAMENFVELKSAIDSIQSEQITVDVRLKADKASMEQDLEKIIEDNYSTPKNHELGRTAAMRQRLAYQQSNGVDLNSYFESDTYKKLPDDIKGAGGKSYESLYRNVAPGDLPGRLSSITQEVATLKDRLQQGIDNGGVFRSDVDGRSQSSGRDPKAYLTARLGVAQQIQAQLSSASQTRDYSIQATQSDIGADQRQADYASKQQATAAGKKANEERLRALEAGAVHEKAIYGTGIYNAQRYWQQYVNVFEAGSDQYNAVQAKIADGQDHQDLFKKAAEMRVKAQEAAGRDSSEMVRQADLGAKLSNEQSDDALHTGPRYTQFRREQYAAQGEPAAAALAQREAALARSEATGTISRQADAMERARLSAQRYADQIAEVVYEQGDLKNQNLNKEDAQTQAQALQNRLDQLRDAAKLQAGQDQGIIDDAGLQAEWKNTLNHFVQASEDTARQIGSIFTDSIQGANTSLAQAATGEYRTNRERIAALRDGLSNTVRGAGSQVANAGLQKLEGGALKALGFGGKPDGSSNNPLFVKMAGGLGSAAAGGGSLLRSAGSWLSGLLGGGHSAAAPSGLPGVAQQLGQGSLDQGVMGAILQGAFASGGDVVANRPALIGEKGPELFVPSSAGRIVPNNQLMGGDTHLHYAPTIDARGATDPGMVTAIVNRQLQAHAPSIIAAANYKAKDTAQRRPASAR